MSGPSNRFEGREAQQKLGVVGMLKAAPLPWLCTILSWEVFAARDVQLAYKQWWGKKGGRKHSGVPGYTLVCFELILAAHCFGHWGVADVPWVGAHCCFVLRRHWARLIAQTTQK